MMLNKWHGFLQGCSIKNKLIIIGVMISAFGLIVFGLGMMFTEVSIVKKSMLKELSIQAKIIGDNSTAALTFNDPKSAEEILTALKANTTIDYCILYTKNGKPFATYSYIDEDKHPLIPFSKIMPNRFELDHVSVYHEIILDGKVVGGVYIQSNLHEIYSNLLHYGFFLLLLVFFALFGSYAVSKRLQKSITKPIIQMVELMQRVSEEKNYTVRTPVESRDELGLLAEGFNEMLSQIQTRDIKLETHRQNLQVLVDQRTGELQSANEQLRVELTARSEAENMAIQEKVRAQMYLDIAGVAIIAIAIDQTVIRVNKKCCTLLGVEEGEILGKNWFEHFIPQRERETVKGVFTQLLTGEGEPADYFENTVLTKWGEERLIAWHNTLITEENDQISAVLSSGEDITEQRIMETDLKTMNKKLEALSVTDGLTGLFNHRFFYDRLEEELKRAERFGHSLSVIILDIDFFKHYNDTQGHLMGDVVLRDVAVCLKQSIREQDIAARYGGEEFTVILPETDRTSAREIAERIRETIEAYPFLHKESQPNGNLTVSLGCATYPYDAKEAIGLTKCSDDALYKAKDGGRNRVEQAI
jgi:diguanylate cyclase (GGDEF)-like protein/PAS domain S-box-containing protein